MTSSLFSNDFDELQKLVNNGDREGYYDYLEDRGFRYGRLAGDVVTGDSLSGRMANLFLAEKAGQLGVIIDPNRAKQISLDLMAADLGARTAIARRSGGILTRELFWQDIRDYHGEVFERYGLDLSAWTATGPLEAWRRNYSVLGYESADDAADDLWEGFLTGGFGNNHRVFRTMMDLGAGRRDRDLQAYEWWDFTRGNLRDEAWYLGLGRLVGRDGGSPYPPDPSPFDLLRGLLFPSVASETQPLTDALGGMPFSRPSTPLGFGNTIGSTAAPSMGEILSFPLGSSDYPPSSTQRMHARP